MPDMLGPAIVAPTRGLYVGSTSSPRIGWNRHRPSATRVTGRKAVLTRYPKGILLERSGADPIWIPQDVHHRRSAPNGAWRAR